MLQAFSPPPASSQGRDEGESSITASVLCFDEMPLSLQTVQQELAIFEQDQAEADRIAFEMSLHLQIIMKRGDKERVEEDLAFHNQSTFRWAVPPASVPSGVVANHAVTIEETAQWALQPSVIQGAKFRPLVVAARVDVPEEPFGIHDEVEADEIWGDRASALRFVTRNAASTRRAREFDLEEDLFAAREASSDDSDGYDPDLDREWRDETSEVYSLCRALEATNYTGELEASNLARYFRTHKAFTWTNTEESILWNAIRMCYRRAEPLHSKHWLSSMQELQHEASFQSSPSVALFSQIIFAAMELANLNHRIHMKIRRWANRSTYLVRRRLAVLRELGILQPTWFQVHASVGKCDRDAPVPSYTLGDALALVCGDDTGDLRVVPPDELTAAELVARVQQIADEERDAAIRRLMASNDDDEVDDCLDDDENRD